MTQDYTVLHFANQIEKFANLLGKPVVYLRSYGWNNSTDVEKINQSMDVYKSMLPIDIYNALHDSEFVFLEIDNLEEAIQYCEDTFPKDQSKCEKEFYIHCSIINELGQTVYSN